MCECVAQRNAGYPHKPRKRAVHLQDEQDRPATDSAHTHKAATTVALRGANSPKVPKMTASQDTSTITRVMGIGWSFCKTSSQRVDEISPAMSTACDRSPCWASLRGESSQSLTRIFSVRRTRSGVSSVASDLSPGKSSAILAA
jgi:hypothetical protein